MAKLSLFAQFTVNVRETSWPRSASTCSTVRASESSVR